jgi:hypothetical protein
MDEKATIYANIASEAKKALMYCNFIIAGRDLHGTNRAMLGVIGDKIESLYSPQVTLNLPHLLSSSEAIALALNITEKHSLKYKDYDSLRSLAHILRNSEEFEGFEKNYVPSLKKMFEEWYTYADSISKDPSKAPKNIENIVLKIGKKP